MMDGYEEHTLFPTPKQAITVLLITFALLIVVSGIGFVSSNTKLNLLIGEIFTILPAVLFLRYKNYSIPIVLRLRPISLRLVLVSALIGVALTIIGDEIDRLMEMLLPLPPELESMFQVVLKANSLGDWLILIVAAVFLAGLFEEMLFRGFLQNALEEKMDITRAVLATAFIFSLFHINPWWLVQIVLLGVILGVMAWKSNSIFPSALVHGINNGIALIAANTGDSEIAFLTWKGHVNPLVLIAAIGALYIGMVLFYRYSEEDIEIPTFLNQPL